MYQNFVALYVSHLIGPKLTEKVFNQNRRFLLFLTVVALILRNAYGGSDYLSRFLYNIETFEAKYTLLTMSQGGDVHRSVAGVFSLKRPGRFRWESKSKISKVELGDGQSLCIVDHDLKTVTKVSQKKFLIGTPLLSLVENSDIEREFVVSEYDNDQGISWVKLTSRDSETQLQEFDFGFDDTNLRALRYINELGSFVLIKFSDVRLNPTLDDELFRCPQLDEYDFLDYTEEAG